MENIQQQAVNAIRALGIDAINKANSGHPGIVLGAAPMAYTLFADHLVANPKNSRWFNRDRFVLAAGHGSMLLYGLLHLSGYDVSMDDLKQFRQLNSKTPGHPEFEHTDGVDATSGPLGQGIPMAVGMAFAEKFLAARYNRDGFNVVDHYTYALCGDGDLMEGATAEASSLAGHMKLDRLIVLYDSNDICLDGRAEQSFTEDVRARYESYGWHTLLVEDGTDIAAMSAAIAAAKAETGKPTLIEIKTIIGHGSMKQGTNATHGAPLGDEDGDFAKSSYNWPHAPFEVPTEVYAHYEATVAKRGAEAENTWNALLTAYATTHPELAAELQQAITGDLAVDLADIMPTYEQGHSQATRDTNNEAINAIAQAIPFFLGGSADLSSSNKTNIKDAGDWTHEMPTNRNINFGVREFAMAAMLNGMALHTGMKVFGATFFVFSDYLKPAIRMASLMGLPVTYVLTHDSIAVGEDGPTHEPVEQLAMLRSLPNLSVIRPADANETSAAWRLAVESQNTPTALVLTRQNLTTMAQSSYDNVKHGAYIMSEAAGELDGIIIAAGSEVNLAMDVQAALAKEGTHVRVVSMPSMDLFDQQSAEYQEKVLPKAVRKRLSLEMGTTYGWHRYVGFDGVVFGIDTFGASAPAVDVIKEYGFTTENIVKLYKGIE
ncbi:MAG: transketolase [Turicibacter sp.]|nr:transketolase [Turicibacter sp.]